MAAALCRRGKNASTVSTGVVIVDAAFRLTGVALSLRRRWPTRTVRPRSIYPPPCCSYAGDAAIVGAFISRRAAPRGSTTAPSRPR
jgi:hypothetical protein